MDGQRAKDGASLTSQPSDEGVGSRARDEKLNYSPPLTPAPRAGRSLNPYLTLYTQVRGTALRRGLTFSISQPDFFELVQRPCFYCGAAPELKSLVLGKYGRKKHGAFKVVASGVDRIENTIGYEPTNVVPCCGQCNRTKSDMPFWDFYTWLKRLVINFAHLQDQIDSRAASGGVLSPLGESPTGAEPAVKSR